MFCTVWHLPPTLCRLRSSAAVSWSEADPSATKAVSGTDGRVVSQLTESDSHTHDACATPTHLYRDQLFISVCRQQTALLSRSRVMYQRLLDTNPRLTVTDAERSEFGLDEIIRNHELFEKKRLRCDRTGLPSGLVVSWRPTPPAPVLDLWPQRLPGGSTYCFVRRELSNHLWPTDEKLEIDRSELRLRENEV